ncbi:DUF2971 domain-containing protein [Tamlana flava]|uniref:DUF2971 domain-containing protein n=1 Tax=Tamlana flava TaxID=3158572 RepID=UPI00351AB172
MDKRLKVNYGSLDDIPLPEIVYKYRDWSNEYHKRFITEREVYMASPRAFEDELDCHSPTRFDLLTKKQIYEYFLWSSKKQNKGHSRQEHRKFARDWAKTSLVNDKKYVKKFMEDSIEEYYDHEGILSLTENWNNDKMWNKYASNGEGFCLGYNARTMFRYLGGGGYVDYVDELPDIFPEPIMQFEEAMNNRIYKKLKKWSFEEEYRTKKFFPSPASSIERRTTLPREAFSCVILGDNISDTHKSEIELAVKEFIGEIGVFHRKDYI